MFSQDILEESLNVSFETAKEAGQSVKTNVEEFKSKLTFVNDLLLFIIEEARTYRNKVVERTSQLLFERELFQHSLYSDRVWIVVKLLMDIAGESVSHDKLIHLEKIEDV